MCDEVLCISIDSHGFQISRERECAYGIVARCSLSWLTAGGNEWYRG